MTPFLIASLATTALFLYGLALAAQPIDLTVRPMIGFAPLDVRADVHIARHADNRQACVELDGPKSFAGCWPLDGTAALESFSRWWNDLPSGQYHGQARVLQGTRIIYSHILTIRVVGDEL